MLNFKKMNNYKISVALVLLLSLFFSSLSSSFVLANSNTTNTELTDLQIGKTILQDNVAEGPVQKTPKLAFVENGSGEIRTEESTVPQANPDLGRFSGSVVQRFEPDRTNLIRNPGMGWMLYIDACDTQLHPELEPGGAEAYWQAFDDSGASSIASIFYMRIPWSLLEPEEGKYAWIYDDNYKALVQGALDRGIRLAFRVYVDSWHNPTQGTPEFVFEKGASHFNWPNWRPEFKNVYADDPVFRKAYTKFLEAFTAKYDDPSQVVFFDGMGLGRWGEMHGLLFRNNGNATETFNWITGLYRRMVTKVLLGAQQGGSYNKASENLVLREGGYDVIRRDSLGSWRWFPASDRQQYIGYAQRGITVFGENCYHVFDHRRSWWHDEDGYPTVRSILDSAMSDASICRVNTFDLRTPIDAKHWTAQAPDLVWKFALNAGYRFYPEAFSWQPVQKISEPLRLWHSWQNLGWGRLPNNTLSWGKKYRVSYALIDNSGSLVAQIPTEIDPGTWEKGQGYSYDTALDLSSVPNLKAGTYRLAVSITNRDDQDRPAIKLAVPGETDNLGWLVLGQVSLTDDPAFAQDVYKPLTPTPSPVNSLANRLTPLAYFTNSEELKKGNQSVQGPLALAFDGRLGTLYHSAWSGTRLPLDIDFYLTNPERIESFIYVPRGDGEKNGIVTGYEFYAAESMDAPFNKVAEGRWEGDTSQKEVRLDNTQKFQKFRLRVTSSLPTTGNKRFVSASELVLRKFVDPDNPSERQAIDTYTITNNPSQELTEGKQNSEGPIRFAYDNNINTIYHSSWGGVNLPMSIDFSFDESKERSIFVYQPRVDEDQNGIITSYELLVAPSDDADYVSVSTGTWVANKWAKTIDLSNAGPIKKARLVVKSTHSVDGNTYVSASELIFMSSYTPEASALAVEGFQGEGANRSFYVAGEKLTGLWTIEGKVYLFDDQGNSLYGEHVVGNQKMYFDTTTGERIPNPEMNGWIKMADGNIRYYTNDVPAKGVTLIGKTTYLFDGQGNQQRGWHVVNGVGMYFNPINGGRWTGLRTIGKTTYLLDAKKGKLTGWHIINGVEMYFDMQNGGRRTGLVKTDTGVYYLLSSTKGKLKGWHLINGKAMYFSPVNGARL